MMDEQLIDEVAHHSVIYNRQKYYLNGHGGNNSMNKYETKDEAWQIIAMKLRSDVETCKKRWKYLRERYVSQRKQGDPPVYEHLSRPYLEKMKFLDQHIQPRKSYRSMPNYLTSPHSANSSFNGDYSMDAKSNGSHKSMSTSGGHYGGSNNHHYVHASQDMENANGQVKIEADQMFRDFAAAVASQQLHQHQVAAVAAAIADSSQNYQEHFRDPNMTTTSTTTPTTNNASINSDGNGVANVGSSQNNVSAGLPSSSSSMKSPLSSPLHANNSSTSAMVNGNATASQQNTSPSSTSCSNQVQSTHGYGDINNDDLDHVTGGNYNMKKPRVQLNSHISNSLSSSSNNNNNSNAINNNNNNNSNNNQSGSSNINGHHSNNFGATDTDDDSDENSHSIMHPQTILNENPYNHNSTTATTSHNLNSVMQRANTSNSNQNQFSSNAEFLFQLYQQLPHQHQQQLANHHQQQQQSQPQQHNQTQQHYKFQTPQTPNSSYTGTQVERSSEQLLGELVTTELLKMSKERRKIVQKRILEILFFDD